jgi:hypothetical protein
MSGALGARKEGKMMERTQEQYSGQMMAVLTGFMGTWKGKTPRGYSSENQYYYGTYQLRSPSSNMQSAVGQLKMGTTEGGIPYLKENKLRKQLKEATTIEEQQEIISDFYGRDVTLLEFVGPDNDWVIKEDITGDPNRDPSSFESLDAIKAAGGTPSTSAEYQPWIQEGQQAYTALTDAIVHGDMSGFYTSPGYEFRQEEAAKEINRMQASGRIPTQQANQANIETSQNIASQEFQNYLSNLGNVAQMGYQAQNDLQQIKNYYTTNWLNTSSGMVGNIAGMRATEGQLLGQGTQIGWDAIGKGVQSIGGGMGGMGGGSSSGYSGSGSNSGSSSGSNSIFSMLGIG